MNDAETPAQRVIERLLRIEERLERLLASGWRTSGAEAVQLAAEAEELAGAGLEQFAQRLRAVAVAMSAAEALPAIALAATASRLLRAHLGGDPLPANCQPVETSTARAVTAELIPLARSIVMGREVLSCASGQQWLLIEPPAPEQGLDLLHELSQASGLAGGGRWLSWRLRGLLRWRATLPLGADGDVQLCAIDDFALLPPDKDADPLAHIRRALASDGLKGGLSLHGMRRGVQVKRLDPAKAADYIWLDPGSEQPFRAAGESEAWALAWVDASLIAPIALLKPQNGSPPLLVHLVPGLPADVLAE